MERLRELYSLKNRLNKVLVEDSFTVESVVSIMNSDESNKALIVLPNGNSKVDALNSLQCTIEVINANISEYYSSKIDILKKSVQRINQFDTTSLATLTASNINESEVSLSRADAMGLAVDKDMEFGLPLEYHKYFGIDLDLLLKEMSQVIERSIPLINKVDDLLSDPQFIAREKTLRKLLATFVKRFTFDEVEGGRVIVDGDFFTYKLEKITLTNGDKSIEYPRLGSETAIVPSAKDKVPVPTTKEMRRYLSGIKKVQASIGNLKAVIPTHIAIVNKLSTTLVKDAVVGSGEDKDKGASLMLAVGYATLVESFLVSTLNAMELHLLGITSTFPHTIKYRIRHAKHKIKG